MTSLKDAARIRALEEDVAMLKKLVDVFTARDEDLRVRLAALEARKERKAA